MISQLSLFKKKNKTSVENSIAVVGVTKALLIGRPPSITSVSATCSTTPLTPVSPTPTAITST